MAILTFVMFTVWGFVRSFMDRPPGDYETEVCDIRLKDKKYKQALESANNDDLKPMNNLLKVLAKPYENQEGISEYQSPAPPTDKKYQTFCGT